LLETEEKKNNLKLSEHGLTFQPKGEFKTGLDQNQRRKVDFVNWASKPNSLQAQITKLSKPIAQSPIAKAQDLLGPVDCGLFKAQA
jgi:hypothetical protein